MHEVGMMQHILEMAVERAKQEGAQHINRVHMRVGSESGVVPDSLTFAFEVAKKARSQKRLSLKWKMFPFSVIVPIARLSFIPLILSMSVLNVINFIAKCDKERNLNWRF